MIRTLAHILTALAITTVTLAPMGQAQAGPAQARRMADKVMERFNNQGIFVTDQAFGVVAHGGQSDYVTFMTAGVKYHVFVSGDSNIDDIGISFWGPKQPNGNFSFIKGQGIKEESSIKRFRSIVFYPRRSGLYLARIHMFSGNPDGAHIYTVVGIGGS